MIDVILLAVIALSALLGFFRGLVGVVIGTLSWVVAGWCAFQFGPAAARWFAAPQPPEMLHLGGGYIGVFVATMIVVSVLGMVLRGALQMARLGGVDRFLGAGAGIVRGALIAAVLLLIGDMTPLRGKAEWQQSHLRPALQPVVGWMDARLPDVSRPMADLQQVVPAGLPGGMQSVLPGAASTPSLGSGLPIEALLGKPGATGDNGILGEVVAGRGWPRNVDPARGAADEHATAPALPANIESAPERPDPAAVP